MFRWKIRNQRERQWSLFRTGSFFFCFNASSIITFFQSRNFYNEMPKSISHSFQHGSTLDWRLVQGVRIGSSTPRNPVLSDGWIDGWMEFNYFQQSQCCCLSGTVMVTILQLFSARLKTYELTFVFWHDFVPHHLPVVSRYTVVLIVIRYHQLTLGINVKASFKGFWSVWYICIIVKVGV